MGNGAIKEGLYEKEVKLLSLSNRMLKWDVLCNNNSKHIKSTEYTQKEMRRWIKWWHYKKSLTHRRRQ